MGKNFFASLIERVFPVAQYAKYKPSVWCNGKEYPWDGKLGKYVRWYTFNGQRFFEEPDYNTERPETSDSFTDSVEKPAPPMTVNHPTSKKDSDLSDVQTSEDFLKVVAIERSKTMSPEIAEWERAKTITFVAGLREYIKQDIELCRLRSHYFQINNLCEQSKGTDRYSQYAKEKEEVLARGLSLREQTDKFSERINLLKTKLSDKEREQNLAFLKAAFPDRDGFSFVTSDFKKEALAGFKKLGIEKDAQYVLDVVDIIGKSFNLNPKRIKSPTLKFKKIVDKEADNSEATLESLYDRYENYDRYKGTSEGPTIFLSDQIEHRDCLMNLFAFHLGEWIHEKVLGLEQMEDNQDWLQRETGDFYTPDFGGSYRIPHEKAPFLCVDPDGSSMTLAHPQFHLGSQKKNHIILSTDVFPSGIQWLALYPEMFAVQSPKHFDQMLRNFRALGIRNKRT